MADRVSRDEVIAFRLGAQNLTERLGEGWLLDAAGRCAIQDSPPGSALLALNARVRGLTPDQMAHAVSDARSLLRTWSMRGSPFCFPAADAPVFTTGALPPTEEGQMHLVPGVVPALDTLGMSLTEAVELTGAEIGGVLSGRQLAITELGAQVAARIAPRLPAGQRATWQREGPYAPAQPLGEGVVHFCLRILTLRGILCFAPRAGNKAPFVLVDEWLGHPIPDVDPQAARAELLRRYLRCYGPSTRRGFAAWIGIHAGDTEAWWGLVADELAQVEFAGPSWVLAEDLDALRGAPQPSGVRLLPPRDPYTQLSDRETILDRTYHREVWRSVGEPGTVLVRGEVIGTWRPARTGRRLTIRVRTFGPLTDPDGQLLRAEAEQVAVLRGASSVVVEFATS